MTQLEVFHVDKFGDVVEVRYYCENCAPDNEPESFDVSLDEYEAPLVCSVCYKWLDAHLSFTGIHKVLDNLSGYTDYILYVGETDFEQGVARLRDRLKVLEARSDETGNQVEDSDERPSSPVGIGLDNIEEEGQEKE